MIQHLIALAGGHFGYHAYDTYGTDQIQTIDQLYANPTFRSITQGLIDLLHSIIGFFTQTIPNTIYHSGIYHFYANLTGWSDYIIYTLTIVSGLIIGFLTIQFVKKIIPF